MCSQDALLAVVRIARPMWPIWGYVAEASLSAFCYAAFFFFCFAGESSSHWVYTFLSLGVSLFGCAAAWALLNVIAWVCYFGPRWSYEWLVRKAQNREVYLCLVELLVTMASWVAFVSFAILSAYLGSIAEEEAMVILMLSLLICTLSFTALMFWTVNDLGFSDCFVAVLLGMGFSHKWSWENLMMGAFLPSLKYVIIPYGTFLNEWERRIEAAQQPVATELVEIVVVEDDVVDDTATTVDFGGWKALFVAPDEYRVLFLLIAFGVGAIIGLIAVFINKDKVLVAKAPSPA